MTKNDLSSFTFLDTGKLAIAFVFFWFVFILSFEMTKPKNSTSSFKN